MYTKLGNIQINFNKVVLKESITLETDDYQNTFDTCAQLK